MGVYKLYRQDKKKVEEGSLFHAGDGAKIWCAKADASNTKFAKAFEKYTRSLRGAADAGALSNEESNLALAMAYADGIVTKWEGITDQDNKPLELNFDNIVKLFTDLPDLFQKVIEFATNYKNFLEDGATAEQDAKKSPNS